MFAVNASHILAKTLESLRDIVPHIEICEGIPKFSRMTAETGSLVILEDIWDKISCDPVMYELITFRSRHANINIIIT